MGPPDQLQRIQAIGDDNAETVGRRTCSLAKVVNHVDVIRRQPVSKVANDDAPDRVELAHQYADVKRKWCEEVGYSALEDGSCSVPWERHNSSAQVQRDMIV